MMIENLGNVVVDGVEGRLIVVEGLGEWVLPHNALGATEAFLNMLTEARKDRRLTIVLEDELLVAVAMQLPFVPLASALATVSVILSKGKVANA